VPDVTAGAHDFRHTRQRGDGQYNDAVNADRWLTVAGFVTWLLSGLPMLLRMRSGQMSADATIVWAFAFPLFGLAFALFCLGGPGIQQRRWVRRALIALQSAAGIAMTSSAQDVFPAGTLVIVAGQLNEFPPRMAMTWIAVHTLVIARVGFLFASPIVGLAIAASFGGFQLFAVAMATLASRERLAREALTRAHTELLAARAQLADSSRNEERLRISRDLHDTLGHHLTALSLQLDVASRLTDGKAAEHVQQAHAITRLLLSDVRDVVSELRSGPRVNLGRAMRALAAQSSEPVIHLDLPDGLEIEEAPLAEALLKCVQEIITNTMRHASARNLRIALARDTAGITIHARDDGHGTSAITPGNGLTGMRERFEALGGRVEFRSSEGRGFDVHGFIPTATTS
jgi:signal transduction histidine kinase